MKALAPIAVAAALTCGVAGLAVPASAALGQLGPHRIVRPAADPAPPVDHSLGDRPAELAADVGAREHATVTVAATTSSGRLRIRTHRVKGRSAAIAAIAAAQRSRTTRAVDVATPVHVMAGPDDPLYAPDPGTSYAGQWGLIATNAAAAWPREDGTGETIAVVDTGIDRKHPDLTGKVLPGADLVANLDGTVPVSGDDHGHGTHVAGIAAADTDNGVGVAGMAPGAKLLPVKALDSSGSGSSATIAAAIIWAADHGADVINLSLGGAAADPTDPMPTVHTAVQYATGKGVTVVAAGGNSRASGNEPNYPGAFAEVIAVAAVDGTRADATFSNTGAYIDVAAPGVDIMSTFSTTETAVGSPPYRSMSGTSMATPFVAGLAALVREQHPGWNPAQVAARIETTAGDLGACGRDDITGFGLIDPPAALGLRPPSPPASSCPTASAIPTVTASPSTLPTSTPTRTPSSRPTQHTSTALPTHGSATITPQPVLRRPTIATMGAVRVRAGRRLVLHARVTGATATSWWKRSPHRGWHRLRGRHGTDLVIGHVRLGMDGARYRIRAINAVGSAKSTARLRVLPRAHGHR